MVFSGSLPSRPPSALLHQKKGIPSWSFEKNHSIQSFQPWRAFPFPGFKAPGSMLLVSTTDPPISLCLESALSIFQKEKIPMGIEGGKKRKHEPWVVWAE